MNHGQRQGKQGRAHRDVAAGEGLVLGVADPPVLRGLHRALGARHGLAHLVHLSGAALRDQLADGAVLSE